jgi:hypothetical protein
LSFPGASPDQASRYADELKDELLRLAPKFSKEKERDVKKAMDFGATLAIILGSAAVTALAKGIAVFTAKHGDAIIDVKTKNGDFRVERGHVSPSHAASDSLQRLWQRSFSVTDTKAKPIG